jgi:hypothetical protein
MSGRIHDLGYKRYVGARRAPSTRWRVIARHEIGSAWKTWWRLKVALALAVIITFAFGSIMYFSSGVAARVQLLRGGMVGWIDAALPMSIEWYVRVAFYASLTIGAGAIAGDYQSGAFTFYFARSVRPRDYVIGKLVGFATVVAVILIGGPLLLALIRLGICDTFDEVVQKLVLVPRIVGIGALAALAFATVPLAFSSLVASRRTAIALWAGYYWLFGFIVQRVGTNEGGEFAMLDIFAAVRVVAFDSFDITLARGWGRAWGNPFDAAIVSLVGHAAIAIGIVWWRVRTAQRAGVVSSS